MHIAGQGRQSAGPRCPTVMGWEKGKVSTGMGASQLPAAGVVVLPVMQLVPAM